jgi:hypothetical protein
MASTNWRCPDVRAAAWMRDAVRRPSRAFVAALSDRRIIGASRRRSSAVSTRPRTAGCRRYATSRVVLSRDAVRNGRRPPACHSRPRESTTANATSPGRVAAYSRAAATRELQQARARSGSLDGGAVSAGGARARTHPTATVVVVVVVTPARLIAEACHAADLVVA